MSIVLLRSESWYPSIGISCHDNLQKRGKVSIFSLGSESELRVSVTGCSMVVDTGESVRPLKTARR